MKIFLLMEEYYDGESRKETVVKAFHAETLTRGFIRIKEYLKQMKPKQLYLGEDDHVYPSYYIQEYESE